MTAPTKARGQQIKPTIAEVNAAWARLRAAAGKGDVYANALLIALTEQRPVMSLPA
ncbi:hypothetical protein [Pseudomonas entomophila]|uniref:hypothetical protein n=1 Tax=Pseudomonas entomophila TaxID=312306 RepID=UPI001F011E16|nr:hypothetical protein [Pseudomonas entomophila]MCG8293027.1 hypothetical protein [Pseudomonas entomophila]